MAKLTPKQSLPRSKTARYSIQGASSSSRSKMTEQAPSSGAGVSFPKFRHLPPELRMRIWEDAIPMPKPLFVSHGSSKDPRRHSICSESEGALEERSRAMQVSQVNLESRRVFERRYPPCCTAKIDDVLFRVHPVEDIFYSRNLEFPSEFIDSVPFRKIMGSFRWYKAQYLFQDNDPGDYSPDWIPLGPLQISKTPQLREYMAEFPDFYLTMTTGKVTRMAGSMPRQTQFLEHVGIENRFIGFRYYAETERVEFAVFSPDDPNDAVFFRGITEWDIGLTHVWVIRPGEEGNSPSENQSWREVKQYTNNEEGLEKYARQVWQYLFLTFNQKMGFTERMIPWVR